MQRIIGIIIISGLFLAVNAQTPTFFSPESLRSSGSIIDVTWYGSPVVYDWDGDGRKDIVTGQYSGGYVRFYRNTGTNNNPSFSGFSYLQADGRNISVYAS
jgi:hypothetical protein